MDKFRHTTAEHSKHCVCLNGLLSFCHFFTGMATPLLTHFCLHVSKCICTCQVYVLQSNHNISQNVIYYILVHDTGMRPTRTIFFLSTRYLWPHHNKLLISAIAVHFPVRKHLASPASCLPFVRAHPKGKSCMYTFLRARRRCDPPYSIILPVTWHPGGTLSAAWMDRAYKKERHGRIDLFQCAFASRDQDVLCESSCKSASSFVEKSHGS